MIYRPSTSRKVRILKRSVFWRTDKNISLSIYMTGDKVPIVKGDKEAGFLFSESQRLWV